MDNLFGPSVIVFPLQAEKFDGEDFQLWKFKITNILTHYGVEEIVTGSIPKPDKTTNPELFKSWLRQDALAKSILSICLSNSILKNLLTCTTAAEIWHNLLLNFDDAHTKNALMLVQKFQNIKMRDTDSIEEYFEKVRNIVNDLKEVGELVSDVTFMGKILSSLPSEFNAFVHSWQNKDINNTDIELLKKSLMAEEKQVNQTEKQLKRTRTMVGERDNFIFEAFCYKCSAFGHLEQNCPKNQNNCPVTQSLESQQSQNTATKRLLTDTNPDAAKKKNQLLPINGQVAICTTSNSVKNSVSTNGDEEITILGDNVDSKRKNCPICTKPCLVVEMTKHAARCNPRTKK